ncbi:hypothetical protein [Methylobacterium sp. E-046]|uniref:hypothetical protein n=1 Tax=Methylobacterium sp. E-046 TaxID=2836576 RepID=UPI001FB9B3D8|nr:hypothetical protein [Methylobacterium sp. E-046]MCJ2099666.1 hypothetical protein [Methylobacterium sp. E-046]
MALTAAVTIDVREDAAAAALQGLAAGLRVAFLDSQAEPDPTRAAYPSAILEIRQRVADRVFVSYLRDRRHAVPVLLPARPSTRRARVDTPCSQWRRPIVLVAVRASHAPARTAPKTQGGGDPRSPLGPAKIRASMFSFVFIPPRASARTGAKTPDQARRLECRPFDFR